MIIEISVSVLCYSFTKRVQYFIFDNHVITFRTKFVNRVYCICFRTVKTIFVGLYRVDTTGNRILQGSTFLCRCIYIV